MSRFPLSAVWGVLAVLASVAAAADPVTTADLSKATTTARVAEQRVLQLLNRKINAVWEDAPLEEVLNEIATQESIPIWIDKQAMQDEGINGDTQITLNFGQITIWQALHFMLRPLAMTWLAPDGVLEITTQTKADGRLLTRVYDVSAIVKVLEPQLQTELGLQLLNRFKAPPPGMMGMFNVADERPRAPTSANAPARPSDFLLAQFGSMGGGMIGNSATTPGPREPGRIIGESEARSEVALKMLLWQSVNATWSEFDGNGGAIAAIPGQLVIRQTYHAHMEIQSLLNVIEEFLLRGAKGRSLALQRPGYPRDEDDRIVQKLNEQASIEVEDEPLEETLELLHKSVGFRFWIDKQALQDEGINADAQVTVTHNGVALNVVLKHLLDPLALTAVIEEGTLVITTQTKADEILSTRVYNTADLAGIAPIRIASTLEHCTSLEWTDVDGEGGTLFLLAPTLAVIRQTQRGHVEITTLLEDIRKVADPRQPPAATKSEQRIYPVRDQSAIANLITLLPELIPNWDSKQGAIHRLGESLLVIQPASVHERVGEIIGALNDSHQRLHPPKVIQNPVAPVPAPTPAQHGPMPTPPPTVPPKVSPAVPADEPAKPANPKANGAAGF